MTISHHLVVILFIFFSQAIKAEEKKELPDFIKKYEIKGYKLTYFDTGNFTTIDLRDGIGNGSTIILYKKKKAKERIQDCFSDEVIFNELTPALEKEYDDLVAEYYKNL